MRRGHAEDQARGRHDAVVRAEHARAKPRETVELVPLMAVSAHGRSCASSNDIQDIRRFYYERSRYATASRSSRLWRCASGTKVLCPFKIIALIDARLSDPSTHDLHGMERMQSSLSWIEWLDRLDRVLKGAREDVRALAGFESPQAVAAVERCTRQLAALTNELGSSIAACCPRRTPSAAPPWTARTTCRRRWTRRCFTWKRWPARRDRSRTRARAAPHRRRFARCATATTRRRCWSVRAGMSPKCASTEVRIRPRASATRAPLRRGPSAVRRNTRE